MSPTHAETARTLLRGRLPAALRLDVGGSAALYRLGVRRAHLVADGARGDVDLPAYRAATPDPLHDEEQELLSDLAEHHAAEIGGHLARTLAAADIPFAGLPLPVRIDRYGFVVDLDPDAVEARWLRADFPAPMPDQHALAHFLHPILFHCQHTENL